MSWALFQDCGGNIWDAKDDDILWKFDKEELPLGTIDDAGMAAKRDKLVEMYPFVIDAIYRALQDIRGFGGPNGAFIFILKKYERFFLLDFLC
tara:strand:- start:2890 stop:3168 length:279 start_codon:yes stop_codon:yes gene_type:complete